MVPLDLSRASSSQTWMCSELNISAIMELRVGNKYRLGRKIGSGSFGDIYLGEKDSDKERFLTFC